MAQSSDLDLDPDLNQEVARLKCIVDEPKRPKPEQPKQSKPKDDHRAPWAPPLLFDDG